MNYLYVTGFFSDSQLTLYDYNEESNIVLSSENTNNSYIASYDSNGNPLWASSILGSNVNSICTDNNYLYVTGYFSDTLTLCSYNEPSNIILNSNEQNAFISKYDSYGNPIWASMIGGTTYPTNGVSICTDNSYVYVTGVFQDTITLYSYNQTSTIILNNSKENYPYNSYIAKYDLSGNPLWGSVIGGNGVVSNSICKNDYLYILGRFSELILYSYNQPSNIELNYGDTNTYIAKYDPSGNPLWASAISGTFNEGISICTDNNYLYIIGNYNSSASLTFYYYNEATNIVLSSENSNNSYHSYIAKYDSNGNPIWASAIIGSRINSIITDNNYLYVTGYFSDTLTLCYYNEPSNIILNSIGESSYIAKYDLSGNPIWGSALLGISSGNSIITDNSYVYVTGVFSSETLILCSYNSPSTIILINNNTNSKGETVSSTFIVKYDLNGIPILASVLQGNNGKSVNSTSICIGNNLYVPPPPPPPPPPPIIQQPICNPKCNTVYNLQQSGLSRRQLMSQMLRSNSTISYDNSRTASYYITMLSLDYYKNKDLLLILKYTLYMRHFNKLVSCGKYNSNEMYSMIENILANLTQAEYDIVYNIQKVVEDISGEVVITITKTFYVVVDLNKTFFMLKNYNGEYFIPNLTYEFNLEDPSNLGNTFCLSSYQNNIPVSGLTYNKTPGTSGATLLFKVPSNVQYQLYIFNSTLNSYSWGYSVPFIPIVANSVNSNISYTTLQVSSNAILSIYEKNGPKYFITNSDSSFLSSVNYNYSFYYGTYYLQVPKLYSVALLNNLCKNKIQYTGDIQKSVTSLVKSTTSDGTYNFYYDTIQISIYEPFTPISLYSYYYGYLGAINTIIFGYGPSKPYTRTDHPLFNGIEQVYSQTKVLLNGTITLNNNTTLSTCSQYGVYNGTYLFFTEEYITFLTNEINSSTNQINNKTNLFVVSGTNAIIGPGPDGVTNYKFYSGVIQVKILGNFNQMSMYTYNNGYAGGRYILTYGSQFNNFIPHSYDFTTDSNLVLTENPIEYPTNQISLNALLSDVSYNTITTDTSGQILFNSIPYDNTGNTVYTMTKGTYIFYAIGPYIAFMTNNKGVSYTGNAAGYYYILGYAPNKEQYTFYTSMDTNSSHAIIVNVTGNFGYLSICTPSGYNGGQNLISFV